MPAEQVHDDAGVEIACARAHEAPPVGVNPMVVSDALPSLTATRLAPLPGCAMTIRGGADEPSVDIHVLVGEAMKPVAMHAFAVETSPEAAVYATAQAATHLAQQVERVAIAAA